MQYQSLENQQAVAILCIKTSPIPHEEKQERIAQVKSEKIEKLRQILSVEQFDKWYGRIWKMEFSIKHNENEQKVVIFDSLHSCRLLVGRVSSRRPFYRQGIRVGESQGVYKDE